MPAPQGWHQVYRPPIGGAFLSEAAVEHRRATGGQIAAAARRRSGRSSQPQQKQPGCDRGFGDLHCSYPCCWMGCHVSLTRPVRGGGTSGMTIRPSGITTPRCGPVSLTLDSKGEESICAMPVAQDVQHPASAPGPPGPPCRQQSAVLSSAKPAAGASQAPAASTTQIPISRPNSSGIRARERIIAGMTLGALASGAKQVTFACGVCGQCGPNPPGTLATPCHSRQGRT